VGALEGPEIRRTKKTALNFLFTYHRGRDVQPCPTAELSQAFSALRATEHRMHGLMLALRYPV
jgi:hypothetical protein